MSLNFLLHILTATRIEQQGLVICFSLGQLVRSGADTEGEKMITIAVCFSTSLNVYLLLFFFHLGGIKTAAGHEKEETGDVTDTDRVSEGRTGPSTPFICALPTYFPHPFLSLTFTRPFVSLLVLPLPGPDKSTGEEPRDETRGKSQHHEDLEGNDGQDRAAAERDESCLPVLQIQPQSVQDQD